ncbi:hypothetical protein ABNM12_13790 [Pseudomonas syringae]|uniref:Uncharacterized protein n=1 Tax=Pseudomonas syringae UB303 TaxID=1357287 RepID=A0AAJ4B3T3_PSESX|nr:MULTISPECIES: hypothetical protein [Pseudomonas]AKF48720.1 hypothetical protein PsyrB_26525 [Pseudomonas syringae pv. syringae B301D]EXL32032.1 hypothetical protein PssB301D_01633 [Pseudomonas syringae pv. syringae str. B301D-R]KTB83971.1 hypothetical protein AO069_22055 [Pseudomonas syringae pv. syringae PD2774]KWS23370.1 hypothetical protein AL062_14655 [Pseudomonas syringae pv. syringae]KWS26358.1 hypothetical protein AL061_01950 [Pseudomonas syringae pv. syringae]
MTIANKNWQARDDRMPGVKTLKVCGIVTAPQANSVPVLVKSARPAAFSHLGLDLTFEAQDIGAQVLTDKEVVYTQPSGADITTVSVYYNGELLASINAVEVTH